MTDAANDNRRKSYRRAAAPLRLPIPAVRDIMAWEIDSRLPPDSAAGQVVVGRG